jgi:hypothetical protein
MPGETIVTEPAAATVEVPPKAQELKAKLAELDPMFAEQGFWQGFEQGGYNDQKIQQLEGMVANFSKPKQPAPNKAKGGTAQASPIADIWEQYDGTGEIDSVGALADAVESYAAETGDTTLTDAVAEYRANRTEDRSEFGDRGESGYSDAFVAKVQQAAQQPAAQPQANFSAPAAQPIIGRQRPVDGLDLLFNIKTQSCLSLSRHLILRPEFPLTKGKLSQGLRRSKKRQRGARLRQ